MANYGICPNLKQFEHLIACRHARPGVSSRPFSRLLPTRTTRRHPSVIAESVLVKHQLLILNRSRKRAHNLRALDRIITGLCTLLMRPVPVIPSAIVLRPSAVFHLHHVLVKRKYRPLFSPKRRGKPEPRGPQKELVGAIVEMKRRNPTWGCPRIAEQITLAFGLEINKDVVRRILSAHYRPDSHSGGPSWLTFIGHMKDSLWSVDLFRCESAVLRTYWVLVVMDQFTRRIIGFGVQRGVVDWRFVECSIERFEDKRHPSTSARITIRCIGLSNGKPICAS